MAPTSDASCFQELVRDIKESCCRVSETAVETRASLDSIPSTSYELPDGRTIEIGADRFAVPELLFQPTLMDTSDVVRTTLCCVRCSL